MDTIHIEDLEIYAYHGVFPEENRLGQKFLLTLSLEGDFQKAGRTDDLRYSVSYAEVCRFAEQFFTENRYRLIESCAEEMAKAILLTFPRIQRIILTVKKPWAPIGSHLAYASVTIMRERHRVFLSLGSNLGDRIHHIQEALSELASDITQVTAHSSLYETAPWGKTDQPDFINCAAELSTLLSPNELLNTLQTIEEAHGRKRDVHWGPRTLDLDILFFDDLITEDAELVLPHPHLHLRQFVLAPLSEIAPYLVHPLLQKRIYELSDALQKAEGKSIQKLIP